MAGGLIKNNNSFCNSPKTKETWCFNHFNLFQPMFLILTQTVWQIWLPHFWALVTLSQYVKYGLLGVEIHFKYSQIFYVYLLQIYLSLFLIVSRKFKHESCRLTRFCWKIDIIKLILQTFIFKLWHKLPFWGRYHRYHRIKMHYLYIYSENDDKNTQ